MSSNSSPAFEELKKQSKVFDKLDKERADAMEALLLRAEWKAYVEILNSLIEQRGMNLMSPAGSVDGAVAQEHVKGTMYGLLLARDLPHVMVSHMKSSSEPATEDDES